MTAPAGTTDSLDVSWSAPSNAGKPDIASYDLQYRKGVSGPWTKGPQDQAATSATITRLDEVSSYQVQVRATNDEGDSPGSAAGTGQTGVPPDTMPSLSTVEITSSGVLRFDLPGVGVAGVGAGQPVRDALFPARRQAGGISTAAAIRNLEAEELVVSCRLMQEGEVLEEVDIELKVNGQDGRFIQEVFTRTDTTDFVGLVRCTAEGEFTGVAVELDAGNGIFTTLSVVPVQR